MPRLVLWPAFHIPVTPRNYSPGRRWGMLESWPSTSHVYPFIIPQTSSAQAPSASSLTAKRPAVCPRLLCHPLINRNDKWSVSAESEPNSQPGFRSVDVIYHWQFCFKKSKLFSCDVCLRVSMIWQTVLSRERKSGAALVWECLSVCVKVLCNLRGCFPLH